MPSERKRASTGLPTKSGLVRVDSESATSATPSQSGRKHRHSSKITAQSDRDFRSRTMIESCALSEVTPVLSCLLNRHPDLGLEPFGYTKQCVAGMPRSDLIISLVQAGAKG